MTLSRSQVDAAGRRVRDALRSGRQPEERDLAMISSFRATYLQAALDLQMLVEEVRDRLVERLNVGEEHASLWEAAARPKTVEAIIAKLGRSATSLSTMQDIAGARLVVPGLPIQDLILDALIDPLEKRGRNPRVKDTRADGDELGYRAIHIVIDWPPRRAELQLRTTAQQAWAQLVEALDQRFDSDLKHGDGDPAIQEWLRTMSDEIRKGELRLPFDFPPFPTGR